MENSLAVLHKGKHTVIIPPTLGYVPKRIENILHKNLHMNIHSSIIHKSKEWKQPKCPLSDEWMKKNMV